jgi:amidohydrolase
LFAATDIMHGVTNTTRLIEAHLPDLIALRRRLHRIPEPGYQEIKTAAVIREELTRFNVPFTAGVADAPTATIALIGDPAKPCVGLRADIDALPIIERTDLPYASAHPSMMHACGHDGHTAILLGAAAALKEIERELPVCVKLFWQPAEEFGGGAKRLVDAGVLDGRLGPRVSAVFGLHCWPGLKLGVVSTRPGAIMAAIDNFAVEFVGAAGHAAYPRDARDPVVTACEAVTNLQQIVSREFDPSDPAVMTVAKINAGNATNIIPGSATIEGTMRTLSPAARQRARAALERRCAGIAAANACTADVRWIPSYPPTINDPRMAEHIADVARDALGPDGYTLAKVPAMGGEDFAYYLEQVPGCFFWLGMSPEGETNTPACHSDRFDFNDASLGIGVTMFVELVRRFHAAGGARDKRATAASGGRSS